MPFCEEKLNKYKEYQCVFTIELFVSSILKW